ncbi:MAG TPA: TonB-dependent receptor plug domain-containing protein [Opitutaceae bacterium]|nr:TonB-dependent receptor plug domain-containing protein [Opitutaceae bacterium]
MITLSPFEVNASDEEGYSAATSLAGNRLNTELKDVGSAISVVTSQMMRDIAATNNLTLLQYTTNTEVGSVYGNMANAGNGTQLDETSKFSNPNSNTRVRGLAAADNTIDYFLTDIPWDGYNIDRIDMQRGPNAILFGLGSPAGIINAGTRSAGFRNEGNVELRYSRFGSVRSTMDLNRVIVPGQLAIRVDGLYDKEKYQQDPAYQTDKRGYAALRYEPAFLNKGMAHTTLKVNYEKGNVRSNQPRSLTPGDSITPWFLTGTATGYNANGSTFIYNNPNRLGFDARGLQDVNIASIGADGRGQFVKNYNNTGGFPSGTLNPYWQPWLGGQFATGYFGNPMAIYNSGDTAAGTLVNWEPSTIRGIGTNGAIDKSIGGIPFSRMSSLTIYRDISKKVNLPGAKFGLTRNLTLSDPSIFNFYDQLIDGPNKYEWQNFHRYNANISETLFDGKVGFEAAYDKQHYDNGQLNFETDKGQQLFVDVIQYEADGSLNPNFGRPFIAQSDGGGFFGGTDREDVRVTAYAKHDFDGGKYHNFFTKFIGHHILTGLYSDDSRESYSRNFAHYVADNGYKDFINGAGSNPATINSSVRGVYPVIYLGQSLANATTAAGANIPNPTTQAVVESGSIRAFDSTWIATNVNPADPWINPNFPVGNAQRNSTQSENPANYRGWTNVPITIVNSEDGNRDQNLTNASKSKNSISSKALIWQGYFWDGAFVGMYGYRKDRAKAWTVSATRDAEGRPVLDPSTFKLPSTASVVEDDSNSWSGVFHINQLLHQRLPINVSVFYNQSENFQPLAGRVGPVNNLLTPPTGTTKDYGILLSTKDGKYSLKMNHYETKVVNSNGTSGFNSFYLGQMFADYQESRNRFVFEVSDPTNPATYHTGDPNGYTYQPKANQTAADALAAQHADVAGWDALVKSLPSTFFSSWKIDTNQTQISQLHDITYQTPSGFTIPEDNVSKGLEFELYAQPIEGLRLTINASKQEATRNNVGDAELNQLVNTINTALNTTAAGTLRSGSGSTATTALENWNANFWASWLSVKGQENNAVTELRKWRANFIADYDFKHGFLKGFNVGLAYRWQDKVVIGYKPIYYVGDQVAANPFVATSAKFDLNSPYYGPAETNIDLWVGYTHKLGKNLEYRVQLNVRNVGKGNELIPVTVQPDGTVAAWRIAPTQVWSLTNTLSF